MPPGMDRVPFVCLPAVLTDRPLLTHNVLSELNTDWQQGDGAGAEGPKCASRHKTLPAFF